MFRRIIHFAAAPLPALLVLLASSAPADEPFPFPAPPARSRPAMYLAPDALPALPSTSRSIDSSDQTRATSAKLTPSSGIKTAQTPENVLAPRGGLLPPARKSVVANSAETDRRVERLKQQLEELNELLSRPPVEPPVIERTITTPLLETDDHEPAPLIDQPSAPAPKASQPPVPEPPAHEPPARPSQPEQHAVPETGKLSASGLIKGLPVAAMDRVHVADNLFAAAEYLLANDIYEQVDRRAISPDEAGWVEFQLANCSRRLGRLDDAKKRYRRVVSDPTLGWLQDMAKWRLDAIDEREQLIQEHARLEAAIKQSTEVPHAAPKP